MIAFVKNIVANHKIKTSFVGGVLVVATAYGTCSFDPDEQAIKDAAVGEEKAEEPKEPEKAEEPEKRRTQRRAKGRG